MADFVYKMVASVLTNNNLSHDITRYLGRIMNALQTFFNSGGVNAVLGILSGLGASLVILFFYMDLTEKAERELFSLQMLILAFIKLLVAVCLIVYLPEIISGLFGLCQKIYDIIIAPSSSGLIQNPFINSINGSVHFKMFGEDLGNSFPVTGNKYNTIIKNMEKAFGHGPMAYVDNFPLFALALCTFLLDKIACIPAYIVAVSNAIILVLRTTFAPIAVAQCFEDGTRSAGIRYLKKLAATALTFAAIAGVAYAGGALQAAVIDNVLNEEIDVEVTQMYVPSSFQSYMGDVRTVKMVTYNLDKESIENVFMSPSIALCIIAIKIGVIGAVLKASRLAEDIVGV